MLNLNKDNDTPLYRQIYQQVRQLIVQGNILPGERLPPTRQLAHELDVARVTVAQAYDQLQAEGYVETRVGAGTYVSADLREAGMAEIVDASERPFHPQFSAWGRRVAAVEAQPARNDSARGQIDFGFGRSFPHIFPYDIWRRLLARYLSTDDTMLSRYGSVAGFYPLRQALADYLQRWRGVNATPEQVVIVSGAQQALDLLARLLLRRNAEVLVETPGYTDAFSLFRVHGARLVALPVDGEGFPVEKIPADCQARLLFVTPSNQFPQGGTMPLPRRVQLLRWAMAHNALIIEDDYDGELRYDAHPLGALQGLDGDGRIVYLGSFSKVLFPALRLAYVVLPPRLLEPFVQAKGVVDRGAPTLTQTAVADFITEGHFERHLRHLREAYGRRRQVLEQALDKQLGERVEYTSVPAGLHVMVYVHTGQCEARVVAQAAATGVKVYPGAPYHLQKSAPPSILMGFSGISEQEIEEGVDRLATVIR